MKILQKILLLVLCILISSCVSLNREKNNPIKDKDDFYLRITWMGLAELYEQALYLNSDNKSFHSSKLKEDNKKNVFPYVKESFDITKWSRKPMRRRLIAEKALKQFYSNISAYKTFNLDSEKVTGLKDKIRTLGLMQITQKDIDKQEEQAVKKNPGLRIEDGTQITVEIFLDNRFNGLIIENFYSKKIFLLLDYLRRINPEYDSLLEEPQNSLLYFRKLYLNSTKGQPKAKKNSYKGSGRLK